MPVRRRKALALSPSPYNIPNQRSRNESFGTRLNPRGYRRQQRHRHSSWTIHEDSVKQFIPTSISEYGYRDLGGSNSGSCMSLCGMFDADSDENCPGYQDVAKEKNQKLKNSTSNKNESLSGLRSRCYSMPVDVPLRKNAGKAKKSKKSRSSGGYFFDKYMKRFRCSKRSPSLGSDGLRSPEETSAVVNDIEMREVCDLSNSPMRNFRSNRQDMVVMESGVQDGNLKYHQLNEKYQYEADDDAVFADDANDDLYPIRYGTSTKWSAYCLNPTVPAIKTEEYECPTQLMTTSYSNNNITVHVTATPLSPPPPCSVFPPLFWGDATHGPRDSYMPTSPVPSLSDYCYESSCCYSDSNSVTLKAMETLYLCNFRVSVDGEWLCLKELEQGCDVSKAVMAYNCPDGTPLKDMNEGSTTPSPGSSTTNSSTIEQLRVERRNLLGMAKLSIKGLIESSLSAGHTLDSDHGPLQQFFIIMESVLRHGLKSPKHIFAGNKQFWGPLEAIEKIATEAAEIASSVRELPGIKTHVGRARAWLRLALMQKRLADYFRLMVEHRDFMKEFYDTESLVMSEEGIVLSGHLVGLNCIDANLCMKGDDLDNQNAVIDYSLYIRDGNRLSIGSEAELLNGEVEDMNEQENETTEEKIQKLANQKNYLEERNRHLETTLTELQKRSGETSTSNQTLEAELDAAKISLATLREERQRLLDEKENMTVTHRKMLHDRQADLDMERETLVQSRAGLDDMLGQVKKQLKHETQIRMDVERELELQISLKQELEVAMKLLEKDIYSKQDSLVILREQLDNVKAINIDIYKKLQDKVDAVESKGKAISDLEEETKRLTDEVGKLKEKIAESGRQLDVALERADRYSQNLDDSEKRRNALETNLQIEREWRKALELQVEKSGSKITQLETELSMMQLLRQELNDVKNDRDELRATYEEQESTINDLADHLGKSKQNFQDLKDVHKSFADKTWEKDREVKLCAQCEKPFSLARRKHHCRNCGQIFCNTCSDNTMPLASSAKPVRVCDSCHTVLLQRYSAATP